MPWRWAILLLLTPPVPASPLVQEAALDPYFSEEVWPKIGELTCINCHLPGGEAGDSKFLLQDAGLDADLVKRNRDAFARMALAKKDGRSRLLEKVAGRLEHGGGVQLKPDGRGLGILERWVRRLEGGADAAYAPARGGPFFQGVSMISPAGLLRRATLSLAGRLPRPEELAELGRRGASAIDGLLDGILKEEAFLRRLQEGFNDVLLTRGYNGNADDALSYDHFEKTRHWYQKHDLSHIADEKERRQAGYKLANDYREALLREPLELITHLVRNDLPFTQIVTADYQMVSPYTARGYGIFEAVKDRFKNPDDPFEYVPAKLPALKGRNGKVQPSADGGYPHAGLLTMFQYLRRYPTTVTNRNRLRARMYYQHFLGIDVMALAPRVTDAAAVGAKFSNPTMQAPDCVVCHKTIDPLAGLFQDYFNEEGHYGPRKEGWFADMFPPGREEAALEEDQKWRSLQWLGARTAEDPRFAVAMVEHVYSFLFGRRPLASPQDIDDPHFSAKRRAHRELRREIEEIAARFSKSGFNLKTAFKGLIASPFYRVDGLAEAVADPGRRAELDDVGVVRLLTPEQLERKIVAVFGGPWGRLKDSDSRFGILYGGIDSKEVTQRMSDPSGAMGAIQRIMANDVSCKNVPLDFSRPPAERRLFPGVELTDVPGTPAADAKLKEAVAHLHRTILGRDHGPEHPEVLRSFRLFAGILEEANAGKPYEKTESYFCRAAKEEKRSPDPHYAMRAWRAVVTYLLRQDDFLYE
jgi:hypothetical protein